MVGIALKMLFGDPVKALGLVFGIAFSVLLMTQQGGFFVGLISRSVNIVQDAREAYVWVMDPETETAESPDTLRSIDMAKVRGVRGVEWASPLTRALVTIRTLEGRTESAQMIGVDDASLVGMTDRFILGGRDDLRRPGAIAIDILGYSKLWPDEEPLLGREIEINDRRAVIAAITDARPGFSALIVVNARLSQSALFAPGQGDTPSYVLVGVSPGFTAEAVSAEIRARTGLGAMTRAEFEAASLGYTISSTGIAFSFGIVIALGAIVGIAIVGLTFNMFIGDLTRQFAVLKAIGLSNWRIIGMVLAQALAIGFIGYGLGLWLATSFFEGVNQPTSDLKGFYLPWQIAVGVAAATLAISVLATFVSLRRVLALDPATVFRG